MRSTGLAIGGAAARPRSRRRARKRLGGRIVVTRDGPRVFLYAGQEQEAREAERVARELVAAEDLTADIAVTRWHPVEEAWKDASIPLPETPEGEREELRMHEAEAEREGTYEWLVKLDLPSRAEAARASGTAGRRGGPRAPPLALRDHRRGHRGAGERAGNQAARRAPGRDRDLDRAEPGRRNPTFVLLESRL